MADFPILQTPRLRLREIVDDDAPALLHIHGDAGHMKWFGNDPVADLEGAKQLVALFAGWRQMAAPGTRWAIELRDAPGLIGTCGLFAWHKSWRKCALGYELAPEHTGRGLMREALAAIFDWGFDAMTLHRIEAQVHPLNAPSLRLLQGLGFRQEGLLREVGYWGGRHHDLIQHGLLRQEWEAVSSATADASQNPP